jgi:hypothetical protein
VHLLINAIDDNLMFIGVKTSDVTLHRCYTSNLHVPWSLLWILLWNSTDERQINGYSNNVPGQCINTSLAEVQLEDSSSTA